MSRLLHPGFGDYLDRLSVLSLKIAHAAQRDVSHFRSEYELIEGRVNHQPWPHEAHELYARLHGINRALWRWVDLQAEGAAEWPRVTPEHAYTLAESAVMTYRLNEERAEIVRQLNADGVTEKLR